MRRYVSHFPHQNQRANGLASFVTAIIVKSIAPSATLPLRPHSEHGVVLTRMFNHF